MLILHLRNLHPLRLILRKSLNPWLRKLIEDTTLQDDFRRILREQRRNWASLLQHTYSKCQLDYNSPSTLAAELADDCVPRCGVTVSVVLKRALQVLNRDLRLVEHVHNRASRRALTATVGTAGSVGFYFIPE